MKAKFKDNTRLLKKTKRKFCKWPKLPKKPTNIVVRKRSITKSRRVVTDKNRLFVSSRIKKSF